MKYSYYPGCTLKTKAKELNDYAIASAKALGIEMEEIVPLQMRLPISFLPSELWLRQEIRDRIF